MNYSIYYVSGQHVELLKFLGAVNNEMNVDWIQVYKWVREDTKHRLN